MTSNVPYVILEVPHNAAEIPELAHVLAAGYRPGDAFVVRIGERLTAIRVMAPGAIPFAMVAFEHLKLVDFSSELDPDDVPSILRTAVGQPFPLEAAPRPRLVE